MKELSIEQKAKRYNEAIKEAVIAHKDEDKHLKATLERIFPELKESEDEKIRKALIYHFRGDGCLCTNEYRIDYKDICVWLEKQGEHANFRNKIQIGDKVTRNEDGVLVNLSQLNRVAKPADKIEPKFKEGDMISNGMSEVKIIEVNDNSYSVTNDEIENDCNLSNWVVYFKDQEDWELVEQNHADKVEPKFNVGDWIVHNDNGCICQITSIREDDYCLWPLDSDIEGYVEITDIDNKYHLWTIQDAKKGDVLFYRGNVKYSDGIKFDRILLFENLDKSCFALTKHSNCVEDYDININIDYPDNIIPATKEQKEILFMVMKDAGYEWNAEKKELKKIEQTPNDEIGNYDHGKVLDALMSAKKTPEPAWSEEDKDILFRTIDNLKFLKDTISTDPKYYVNIIDIEREITWLKSLRPQSTWKPSVEQMNALDSTLQYSQVSHNSFEHLNSLFNDLKKLREE